MSSSSPAAHIWETVFTEMTIWWPQQESILGTKHSISRPGTFSFTSCPYIQCWAAQNCINATCALCSVYTSGLVSAQKILCMRYKSHTQSRDVNATTFLTLFYLYMWEMYICIYTCGKIEDIPLKIVRWKNTKSEPVLHSLTSIFKSKRQRHKRSFKGTNITKN